ncbi:hypothetical protein [uncultured Erythrobacter sp.]|uniref:hypothetical protein n=1 Tax=uncultured Erythrobacter sp. TaxID=263913 RepID=UPI002639882A|nr:hypothetical protein [uncultured Erythrobacter sp.]
MNLTELHPEYLAALARQFGFLGAFLGGVSATLFVTLLTMAKPGKVVRWAIGLAAVAAVAFIVTAYMSVGVIANSHPNAPSEMAGNSIVAVQLGMSLSFGVGSLALLAAIGVSGWSRSRLLGIVTSIVAFLGAIPLFLDFA